MVAIIGFSLDTGAYKFALADTNEARIRKKAEDSIANIVWFGSLPKYPQLYKYSNGAAVKVPNYDTQAAALNISSLLPKYKTRVTTAEFRNLLEIDERILYDKVQVTIEGDLGFLQGPPIDVQVPGKPVLITPRDQLRTMFMDLNIFGAFDLGNSGTIEHVQLLRDLSIIATDKRVTEVMRGYRV